MRQLPVVDVLHGFSTGAPMGAAGRRKPAGAEGAASTLNWLPAVPGDAGGADAGWPRSHGRSRWSADHRQRPGPLVE